jgi:transposase-like protein
MSRPSTYPLEFRARDAAVSASGAPHPAEMPRELGVGAETFRKWVRQDEADRVEAPGGRARPGFTPRRPATGSGVGCKPVARVMVKNSGPVTRVVGRGRITELPDIR